MRARLFVVSLCLLVAVGCTWNFFSPEFQLKKPLVKPLSSYDAIGFVVNNEGLLSSDKGYGAIFIAIIGRILTNNGGRVTPAEHYEGVRVLITSKYGLGCPDLNMNFEPLFVFLDYCNIKFVETNTGDVVGEVEYNRPFCGRTPPDFVEKMMSMLLESKEAPP